MSSFFTDMRVPKGAPVFGQTEIFGKHEMTSMTQQSRLAKAFKPGRMIRRLGGSERPVESFKPRDVLVHDWVCKQRALSWRTPSSGILKNSTLFAIY